MIPNLSEFKNGKILLVDKPWGWTSFNIVKKIRSFILNATTINIKKEKLKIGHAGTLDPFATGLLIVLTGKYTKKVNEIQNYKKVYTGIIKLGCETLSFDSETEEYNFSAISHITPQLIKKISKKFLGEIDQYPPYFSALKTKGKRFYEYARKGIKIVRQSRRVKIYKFHILKIGIPYIKFFIECGKGTYIRSIAQDFGKALRSGAYILSLRRERIGNFSMSCSSIELKISKKFPCYLLD
ncbi:tRNA pseudouridine(55) synthase TruB [Blattabacterium cuenoti]|uniref:tRNA pseudouridine synthase B n=1 Tax=Blattabacterium cuenoti BPAA TaxID=1229512 RepID=M4ZSE0_9FLAO|nr:tRNA pseudouridine(55) synthase TruB [Blattabacterium cuenoti]BAM99577.1 tRNA-pseudouridine synthase I [Blattabacterium cuenoti BPAA]